MSTTTMPAIAVPSTGDVLRQQMRLLHHSGRTLFLAALTVASLAIAAPLLAYYGYNPATLFLDFAPALMFMSGLFGVFVWRDEPPSKRHYHWTMPVDMGRHELIRVAAGALWLMAAVACFAIVGAVVAFATGGGDAWLRAAPLIIPHYITSSLTLYMLGAALSTRSNRPMEWLIFGYLGIVVFVAVGELAELPWMLKLMNFTMGEPYGLGWAAIAGWTGAEVRSEFPARADLGTYYGEWLPVAALWLLIMFGLLQLAARARRTRA